MTRTGKVISCTYDNYQYTLPNKNKVLYRHILSLELKDGTIVTGKYDSIKLPQDSFIVGATVDFDTEDKVTKNGASYQKFKKAQKPREGGYVDNPEIRMQIERSVSIFCAVECHRNGLGVSTLTLQDLAEKMFAWIRATSAEGVKDGSSEKQVSINCQSALKTVCTGIPTFKIANMDHLWQSAEAVFKFINNG